MKSLYSFKNLSDKLTELGYPSVTESRFEVVRKDLTEEELRGNVDFRTDGIYITINGIDHKGYMYIKRPDIARFGFPKFHITNCSVITEQRTMERFNGHYFWHNSNTVDLVDRNTAELHENVSLELCSRCRATAAITNYNDIQGFFDLLDIQDKHTNLSSELDLDGYVKEWRQISKKFRIENDFTCASCTIKIQARYDQRYIQVHHRNGNKLQNNRENLTCLCCLCHANIDEKHLQNFKKKRASAFEIVNFVKKYKAQLQDLNNPYVAAFVTEHKL
jgi:hypothetical protein